MKKDTILKFISKALFILGALSIAFRLTGSAIKSLNLVKKKIIRKKLLKS